jgi:RNA polymerase sigma-70 factor (ECF subfamily)
MASTDISKNSEGSKSRQQQLLVAARDGNELAFEELMRLHSGVIYRLANGVLASPQQASDVTQDVFLKFYKSLGRIRSSKAIRSWLRRVTLNRCYDLLKKRRKEVNLEDHLAPGCMQQADSWSDAELCQILQQSLDLLSTRQRVALVLTCQLGYSSEQAGRDMGCSAGTVRSLVYKARNKLKQVFYQGSDNWS